MIEVTLEILTIGSFLLIIVRRRSKRDIRKSVVRASTLEHQPEPLRYEDFRPQNEPGSPETAESYALSDRTRDTKDSSLADELRE
jgi:hypothetical protein